VEPGDKEASKIRGNKNSTSIAMNKGPELAHRVPPLLMPFDSVERNMIRYQQKLDKFSINMAHKSDTPLSHLRRWKKTPSNDIQQKQIFHGECHQLV
jgi:hypothetical protein